MAACVALNIAAAADYMYHVASVHMLIGDSVFRRCNKFSYLHRRNESDSRGSARFQNLECWPLACPFRYSRVPRTLLIDMHGRQYMHDI